MMCITAEDYRSAFVDEEWGIHVARLSEAQAQDTVYGPGAWLAYWKWCEESQRTGPVAWCPEDGEQAVVGHGVTGGSDPYAIEHLACGHSVIGFSGDPEDIYVVNGYRRNEW